MQTAIPPIATATVTRSRARMEIRLILRAGQCRSWTLCAVTYWLIRLHGGPLASRPQRGRIRRLAQWLVERYHHPVRPHHLSLSA